MAQHSTCDRQAIERFLDDRLNPQEQQRLELHLEDCDDCRRDLESIAASDDFWSEAGGALSGFESNEPLGDTTSADPPDESISRFSLAFLGPTDDPHKLGRFAGYEIAGVVGVGGMGVVLKALDPALHRFSAIKVLAPHYASSAAARERFSREAQAAAAVVHDNVIAIYGVGECNDLPYLVMPYVRGQSLQKRIDRSSEFSVAEILRIAHQTALGLAAAHDQGLVHRDIKPANILLPESVERVLITDFGLARAADDASLTRSGVIAGTPHYMSPEQSRGEPLDGRSDLFSLGSLMYLLCTGRLPFRAETPYGVLRRINESQPPPIRSLNPAIPDWLCRLIERLHARRPDDRFQSAKELADLLQQCLAHVQTHNTPLPASLRSKETISNDWKAWLIGAGSVALVATVFFAASLFHSNGDPTPVDSPVSPVAEPSLSNTGPTIESNELNQWNDEEASIDAVLRRIDQLDESSDRFFD